MRYMFSNKWVKNKYRLQIVFKNDGFKNTSQVLLTNTGKMTKLLRVKAVVIVMIFSLCYIGNMQRILNIRGPDKATHNKSNQLFSDGTPYYGRHYVSADNAMHTMDLNKNTSISNTNRVFSARENVSSFPNSKTFGSKGLKNTSITTASRKKVRPQL